MDQRSLKTLMRLDRHIRRMRQNAYCMAGDVYSPIEDMSPEAIRSRARARIMAYSFVLDDIDTLMSDGKLPEEMSQ
jgi:phosphate uptake regulator